jgi:hypothetical protein
MHFHIGEDTQAKCRFFLQYTGTAPSVSDLDAFAGVVSGQYAVHLAGEATADRIMDGVVVTDLTSPTSAVGVDSGLVPGTNGGGSLPADVCVLQSKVITRRYRGGHPRVYWPFFSEAELQDAQTWKVTPLGTLSANYASFRAGLPSGLWSGASGIADVNVSYYSGNTVFMGTTGRARNVSKVRLASVIDPEASYIFRAGIASQRKRLLRLA